MRDLSDGGGLPYRRNLFDRGKNGCCIFNLGNFIDSLFDGCNVLNLGSHSAVLDLS